uniref:Uncharacterized protein n=1 Tax=Pristionchus pacificus TaxID=54126 RepID=A0A2A6CCY1_PRIPA|eukprot:PDM75950.1 hypothetical protein PRIPAC_43793 [Pristionchus pacificus]
MGKEELGVAKTTAKVKRTTAQKRILRIILERKFYNGNSKCTVYKSTQPKQQVSHKEGCSSIDDRVATTRVG